MTDVQGSLIAFQQRFPDEAACAAYLAGALAARFCLSPLRSPQGLAVADQGRDLRMRRLPQADLGDRRDYPARLQAAADPVVLGRLSNGYAFQRGLRPPNLAALSAALISVRAISAAWPT